MKDENWESLFFKYLDKVKNKKFSWKNWNCCNFVDQYISSVSDFSFIPNKTDWNNKKTALEAIRKHGDTFPDAVTSVMKQQNIEEINKNFISTGDIVLFKEKEHLLGVCDGRQVIAVSDDGLVTKPMSIAEKVWRIPNV
tara:strand:+ start:413 stop:829 length:417 start_codon:yes stop_codon:yes gene_type:complete